MLLYNHKKEFVGVDQATLRRIGYNTIAELKEDVADFADLFENRPGFVHNFKNFSWIDFIIHNEQERSKARIRCNGAIYQCHFDLDIFYMAQGEKGFKIELVELQNIGRDDGSAPRTMREPQSLEAATTKSIAVPAKKQAPVIADKPVLESKPAPLEMDFDNDPLPEPEIAAPKAAPVSTPTTLNTELPSSITLETPAHYVYDPSIAADELGLPTDLIDEFVGDFIAQAKKFKPDIETAITAGDFDQVQILSHKLKGVAANLRIEDALEVLNTINTSKDTQILRDYTALLYSIIAKLENKSDTSTPVSIEPIIEKDDEDIYAFDLIEDPSPNAHEKAQPRDFDKEEPLDIKMMDIEEMDDFMDTQPSLDDSQKDAMLEDEMLEIDFKEPSLAEDKPSLAEEMPIYDIDTIQEESAQALGVDSLTMKTYIQDFVDHANDAKATLEEALKHDDLATIASITADLRGMSEALHLDVPSDYLLSMQTAPNRVTRIDYAKKLFHFIRLL